jgi:nickel-dependent lactate racemase
MSLIIPYGNSSISLDLPGFNAMDLIVPRDVKGSPAPLNVVNFALQNPLGINLSMLQPDQTVAIGINDKTRPVPHEYLLPPLLTFLGERGISRDRIRLIIASGTHTPMIEEEVNHLIPQEILNNYPIYVHDCDNSSMVTLGSTSRGTPVWINRDFYDANIRICVGIIEPHHFMGFSGGVKTAAIGLAGRATINYNHAHISHPNAASGHFDDNPMRQDVEEIGKMLNVQFVLNAILNYKKEIIHVLAGNPSAVMQSGIPLSREINQISVNSKYDMVIVSPGGYPKDINFYQSQKALTHAGLITRDWGNIILLAECIEGIGNTRYENVMQSVSSHEEALHYFDEHEFEVGPHKAYLVARDAVNKHIFIHSSLTEDQVKLLRLKYMADPQSFLHNYFSNVTRPIKVAIMPHGTTTIPHLSI